MARARRLTKASAASANRSASRPGPVRNVVEFLGRLDEALAESAHGKLAAFRGHADGTWKIVPQLARGADPTKAICTNPDDDKDKSFERRVLRVFPDHAHAYLPPWFATGSDVEVKWKTIVVAQHYRLPTRLLDWSTNPLIALYFCVAGSSVPCSCKVACGFRSRTGRHHGAVLVLRDRQTFSVSSLARTSASPPLYAGHDDPGLIRPPDIDRRIVAQGSLFSISSRPATAVKPDGIVKVHDDARSSLLQELNTLGINRRTVYQDLDSVSEYLTWSSRFWKDDPGYLKR